MSTNKSRFTAIFLFMLGGASSMHAATLDLEVTDESGQVIPCRVLVRLSGSECLVPEERVVLEIGPDRWLMSGGREELSLPAGEIELRIERGLEFSRYKAHLTIEEQRAKHTVVLKRWIDMKKRGYLCGENHLHVSSDVLGSMAIVEGLDFATSLTWWNGADDRRPVPDGPGKHRRLGFAGRQIVASIYDAELEHGWGAAYIQNLPDFLPLPSDKNRPNLDYLRHAVNSGAIVHYQGGYSREIAIDALLGQVHVVNICNNNFHLHRFQPRERYSNLLEIEGFPRYPNTAEGMMRMNTDTWYRLLNWGLRLAAGAGSATGVKEVPVGYNRAYVRADPDASIDDFYQAWREGKNFVTNGPLVFLRAGDGIRPGGEIELVGEGDRHLPFELEVRSDQPLDSIDMIVNGRVAKTFEPGQDPLVFRTTGNLDIRQGSWIAARCTARDDLLNDEELKAYANGDLQHSSRLRFAHTSPIYVTVDGHSTAVAESIEEGFLMLDGICGYARETASADYLPAFLAAVEEARHLLKGRQDLSRSAATAP